MIHPRSLFSLAEHLERLSKDGDPLEVLAGTVEFERFRPLLAKGLGYSDGAKGGRPPFDPVAMFKVRLKSAGTAEKPKNIAEKQPIGPIKWRLSR